MTSTTHGHRTTYTVAGMTCDHCVKSVTTEISKIAGVTDVDIDLPTGELTVASTETVDDAAIADAVDEAGYTVVAAADQPEQASGSCCGTCR
ncbi:heavy-metal-associated domain-containing protein [Streptomyces sp. SPB162]|uniref:heavy-metal-associated domain-containing protein n=1 Tax=Streptomyces sp. SPB162 TaxID=2940560 RepID=UPI0024072BE0|nr:heavy-metal-associated domain-containing protein [Streptomyces sp. SPB162]MDF9817187.1 copper chaperone [Streptomyces sp. SPB162]